MLPAKFCGPGGSPFANNHCSVFSMGTDVPASLKAIKPFIEQASNIHPRDPLVAYHVRLYALQQAMEMRAQLPKPDMGYVIGLMDQLEKEKAALGEIGEDAAAQV